MADSPNKNTDKPLRVSIYSEGNKIKDSFGLISVHSYREVNRIGTCILTFEAGNMPKSEIPESDDDTFAPGKNIRVEAGYGDAEEFIFEGIAISHNLHILQGNRSTLQIECKDHTFQMTLGRKNQIFEKSKDSDAIKKIVGTYSGLQVSADDTETEYNELVQYYCTDWDFVLSRADANGLVVITDKKNVSIKEPKVDGSAVVKVTYGMDLIEFQGELQADTQQVNVEAVAWNPKQQAIMTAKGSSPTLNDQGDATPAKLAKAAGSDKWILQTALCPDKSALKSWADSQMLKTGLARINGHIKFYGNSKVVPGCTIEIDGFGKRFNGNVYVGSVEHEIKEGEWITKAGMGISAANVTENPDVVAPNASGFLPGIEGLHIGKVTKLDKDPTKEYKVQVEIPVLNGEKNMVWARLANFWSSKGYGAFFIPDVGDEVVLGFFNNDPCHAVILGSLYSSSQAPAYQLAAENHTRAIVTKEKMKIEFNEEKKIITITTPGKNMIEISDEAKGITLKDQNNNKIVMNDSGITLDSPKDINIKSKMNINIEAGTNLAMKAKTNLTGEGMQVELKAKTTLKAQGTASAELSASGQTVVKGAMVMIN